MEDGIVISAVFCEQTSAANEIEIIGRKGKLFISGYRFDGLRFEPFSSHPGSLSSRVHEITRTLKNVPMAISSINRKGEHHSTFREEWRHFCQVVRGEAEPKCTLEDGRRAVQVVLATAESDRIGRPVKVMKAPTTV
jgi:predicted dehydrogenase